MKIRQAVLEDVDVIAKTASKYSKELGWVRKTELQVAIGLKELLFEEKSKSYCLYHKKRNGITVIYSIAVPLEYNGKGIAKKFIQMLDQPITLKCPVGNKSNEFYKHMGFTLLGVQKPKRPNGRDLNIWTLGYVAPTVRQLSFLEGENNE